jgi:nucleoside-diphosphate-sugar epimerase
MTTTSSARVKPASYPRFTQRARYNAVHSGSNYIYYLADIVAGVAYVFSHQEAVFHDNVLMNTHTLQASKHNRIPNYIYVGTACGFPKGL